MGRKRPKPLLRVYTWCLSFTLGDGTEVFVFSVCLVVGVTTLGAWLVTDVVTVVSTLDSTAGVGCFVARFKIWVSWMYALVVDDPYSKDGMIFEVIVILLRYLQQLV